MKYAIHNKRMEQMLRHAGVVVVATSSDRVVLHHEEWGGEHEEDPLYRLLASLEPTSVEGHEHIEEEDKNEEHQAEA